MTDRPIRLKMGVLQASAVDMYCLDPAHEGEFLGTVEGDVLVVAPEHAQAVWEWLIDAGNSLDDETHQQDRDLEDRRTARQWRDALHTLTCRLGSKLKAAEAARKVA